MSQNVTIVWGAVFEDVLDSAERGLATALAEMERKAKSYAPVREVFKGQRGADQRTMKTSGKAKVSAAGGNAKRHKAGLASSDWKSKVPRGVVNRSGTLHFRAIRHHQDSTRDQFMRAWDATRRKEKTYSFPTFNARGGYSGTQKVSGHSHSLHPILRDANKGVVTGDLRSMTYDRDTQSFRATSVPVMKSGSKSLYGNKTGEDFYNKYGRREARRTDAFTNRMKRQLETMSPGEVEDAFARASISARRATAIKKGTSLRRASEIPQSEGSKMLRALGLHANAAGELRMGGRLRDEIYTDEIRRDGSSIYGEVVSPTEYSAYQEWGTSHNVAHPYMRPALYNMRRLFPMYVKRELAKKRF
jgi:hypothetical protein